MEDSDKDKIKTIIQGLDKLATSEDVENGAEI